MSDEATVLTGEADGVLVITINRPEAKNAVNLSVAQGVAAALERLDSDDSLRVGVLTGAGGTFCAGMDLKAFVSGEFPQIEGRGFGGMTERSADKPLIAAVEGYALAGGCELAIACDLIVAAENAKFGIPEVKRGLVAAAGGLVRLPSQIPYRVAMELALTGEFMGADRAMAMGLINELTEPGSALDTAKALAHRIAENGQRTVLGDPLRQRLGRIQSATRLGQLIHESHRHRPVRTQELTRQGQLHCNPIGNLRRQPDQTPSSSDKATLHFRNTELCIVRRNDEITSDGQFAATCEGVTLNRCNQRLVCGALGHTAESATFYVGKLA